MPQIKQLRYTPLQDAGPLRVAAYCRVSSDSEDQLNSYSSQIQFYTEYIGQHPDWELTDIYADADTPYGLNPKSPWIPTISVFTGFFIIQSLLTLPTQIELLNYCRDFL